MMHININQTLQASARLLQEGIRPAPNNSKNKILAIALVAFSLLAAYFYWASRKTDPAANLRGLAPLGLPDSPPASRLKYDSQILGNDEGLVPVEWPESPRSNATKPQQPQNRQETETPSMDLDAAEEERQLEKAIRESLKLTDPRPTKDEDLDKALALSQQPRSDEDETLRKVLALSLQSPADHVQPTGSKIQDDDDLQEALRRSQDDIPPPSDNDDDLKKTLLLSEQTAKQKEEDDLKKALAASKGGPRGFTPPPKSPTPQTAKKTPLPTPKKKQAGDAELIDSALPVSDVSDQALDASIKEAKKNEKLKITDYEIKRNSVDNVYLVLEFSSYVRRTIAIGELRSKYNMFNDQSNPNRVGDTQLELTVEQTIQFQNKF